jgi:hypothetical protein
MIGLLKHSSNFYLQPLSRNINYFYRHGRNLLPMTAGLIKQLFADLLEFVIPECIHPSISLGTVRFSNRRESRNWTADPFDVAQGRGEHSRTTIKAFGGDAFGINSRRYVLIPRQLAER